ncbi:acyclic terpene utilization AtuA family protein [Effusibacillus dendaii]|uniref:ABC transporter substrate-binding protein n=1 Tax=Effusibacillus dendaii TaxID=2743772 RepID=A0A7I8DED9_9BACL|nr:acyclic terpene utilization AtuA family protein [Effusibacillus dendaii]BCJ86910.1 ABC transporter substrate-binding protein [Effusibacillus dendaii]
MKKVRIGAGSGYAGDRWEPAIELVEKGDIQYLVFEALAERTIAREHLDRLSNPDKGYNPWLEARMRSVLPIAKQKGVKIITNMGAANPESAAKVVAEIAEELNINNLRIAVVIGDNVSDIVSDFEDADIIETGQKLSTIQDKIISANAYLGAEVISNALSTGADVVITGRTADPSLFLGAMIHALDWNYNDYQLIGQGSVIGHLMECAGQITGGYFADPGYKDVPNLEKLGFPICEVFEDGSAFITKVAGSGGCITPATCKEQMLYEIHDPSSYITPDCIVDFTDVEFIEVEKDRIQVIGGKGKPRTSTYKVSVGYKNGYIGEGQMSYAGPGALERAKLAAQVVVDRLKIRNVAYKDLRVDFIGVQSLHGESSNPFIEPYEVRLRVAGLTDSVEDAKLIGAEVETLLTNGPYGGAGDFKNVREIIGVLSILLPRELVKTSIVVKEMITA